MVDYVILELKKFKRLVIRKPVITQFKKIKNVKYVP